MLIGASAIPACRFSTIYGSLPNVKRCLKASTVNYKFEALELAGLVLARMSKSERARM
ncbi:conserved hypothetical protein [Treponema phagedenis]|uniref:Uncharacterized protein n=1 Tax=Treponema phagedenis TaxID=162 RepID=A0A0B7H1E3_TREPH|nr:conserved hypothetical protein [Treponema phagedenis]